MKICAICGKESGDDYMFCPACGAKLEAVAEVAEAVEEAAPEVVEEAAEEAAAVEEATPEAAEEVAEEATVEAVEEAAEEVTEEAAPEAAEVVEEIVEEAVVPSMAPVPEEPCWKPVEEVKEEVKPEETPKADHTIKGRIFGIIGFIVSLQAIVNCLIPVCNIAAVAESIVGIVFAGISKKNTQLGVARAGKILSIIALVFSVLSIAAYIILLIAFLNMFGHRQMYFDAGNFGIGIGW